MLHHILYQRFRISSCKSHGTYIIHQPNQSVYHTKHTPRLAQKNPRDMIICIHYWNHHSLYHTNFHIEMSLPMTIDDVLVYNLNSSEGWHKIINASFDLYFHNNIDRETKSQNSTYVVLWVQFAIIIKVTLINNELYSIATQI